MDAELCYVYDTFDIMLHANRALDEVRRAEFFRKGTRIYGVVKGTRWLLLTPWVHRTPESNQQLNPGGRGSPPSKSWRIC